MMGIHQPQCELFSYRVNLDQRVRPDHPLRRVHAVVDFACDAEASRGVLRVGDHQIDPVKVDDPRQPSTTTWPANGN